jgi:hypothetical protein
LLIIPVILGTPKRMRMILVIVFFSVNTSSLLSNRQIEHGRICLF